MGARQYSELDVWKLADELRERIARLTASPGFQQEAWLRSQLRRSVQAACANVAEGFGRFYRREFIRFLRTAKGSLEETKEHITAAALLNLVSETEAEELRHLADRSCGAAVRLVQALQRTIDSENPPPE